MALSTGQIILLILCAAMLAGMIFTGLGWRRERSLRRAEQESMVQILEEMANKSGESNHDVPGS